MLVPPTLRISSTTCSQIALPTRRYNNLLLVPSPLRDPGAELFEPCAFRQQKKLEQQTSTAAPDSTTASGRLFVTDKSSKRRFLIDTGSDLCVFPRKLIPQRRTRVNYDLRAANGLTIPTYGWLPLSLNLGLCRDFTWRFVAADVTQPFIGADFLSHFGLLVDCTNNRLLDGVTT
jgi:hypothetical protein